MRIEFNPGEYDWSRHEGPLGSVRVPNLNVEIDDESLRDGRQGSHLKVDPDVETQKIYLASVASAGLAQHADIGFPGSGESQLNDLERIIDCSIQSRWPITLSAAAAGSIREHVTPIIDLSHKFDGYPLEADVFLDVSSYRAEVEGWDRGEMIQKLKSNIRLLKQQGLPVMFVAERSTRTKPEEMLEAFTMAADLGVERLCIADTNGVAMPDATRNIFRWAFDSVGRKYPDIKWDAHFHNDFGSSLENEKIAFLEGADRLHATMFCIGERAGNVDLIHLAANLDALKGVDLDRAKMKETADIAARVFGYTIPKNTPIYGDEAFASASGIHAAAGKKELKANRAHSIYFPFDPTEVGNKAVYEVGKHSGKSSVELKLNSLGVQPSEGLVKAILDVAKDSPTLLSNETIFSIAARYHTSR